MFCLKQRECTCSHPFGLQDEDDRMVKINELLKMIEAQEKAGGESCTPGTELELGENIVDSYGKVTLIGTIIQLKIG